MNEECKRIRAFLLRHKKEWHTARSIEEEINVPRKTISMFLSRNYRKGHFERKKIDADDVAQGWVYSYKLLRDSSLLSSKPSVRNSEKVFAEYVRIHRVISQRRGEWLTIAEIASCANVSEKRVFDFLSHNSWKECFNKRENRVVNMYRLNGGVIFPRPAEKKIPLTEVVWAVLKRARQALSAKEIIEQAQRAAPQANFNASSIFSLLHGWHRSGHLIREGERGMFKYRPSTQARRKSSRPLVENHSRVFQK